AEGRSGSDFWNHYRAGECDDRRYDSLCRRGWESFPGPTGHAFYISNYTAERRFRWNGIKTLGHAQDTDQELPAARAATIGRDPGYSNVPIMPEALPGSDNFPVSFVIASTASQERILELAKQIFLKAMQAHVFQFGDIDTKI